MTVLLHFTGEEFLQLGLELAGYNQIRQTSTSTKMNTRRFMANYGTLPEACSALFDDFQTTTLNEARIKKPNPMYLLMTLKWLKLYQVEEAIAGQFGVVERTFRETSWKYTKALCFCCTRSLSWDPAAPNMSSFRSHTCENFRALRFEVNVSRIAFSTLGGSLE